MIKKINVSQLRLGIFIEDLNCDWMQHPFLLSRLRVNDEALINKIAQSGIQEVYIDTEKGIDVEDAPSRSDVEQSIHEDMIKLADSVSDQGVRNPVKEEIFKAGKIVRDAKITMRTLMKDVRLGKQIELTQVENIVDKMIESISRNKDALTSLLRIKRKDEYTYEHSLAVCALLVSFGEHLDFDLKEVRAIGIGGLLHDIGKVKVPIQILNKRERLTDKEFEAIKAHVKYGCDLLAYSSTIDAISVNVAAQHHERISGMGYPLGLKDDEISLYGRMSAVVDVYDALSSDRCYKKRIPPTETLKKIFGWSGTYFDRNIVEQFICCVGIYPIGTLVRLESGLLCVVINHGERGLLSPVVRVVYDTGKEARVTPYDIDLASSKGSGDPVISYEHPEKWNIMPEDFLYL